jgi:voltage-gated potassium channel Kch
MALSVIYTFNDAKNKNSFTEVPIPIGTTLANAVIFAQQMALLIDAVITGRIARIGIAATVALPGGIAGIAGANSDVEEGALFQYRTALGFHKSMRLPTFNEALIVPASNVVLLTDADVVAFNTAMTAGINLGAFGGTGTVSPCTPREEDLVALDFAVEDFQNSRRN